MDAELAEPIPVGGIRFTPGVGYVVTREFTDDDGIIHRPGERWVYLGFKAGKLYPGYTIYVRAENGEERTFRLKWSHHGQRDIFLNFATYVTGPNPKSAELIARLASEDLLALERVRSWIGAIPEYSNELIEAVDRARENASIASEKIGVSGNPYEQPAVDLARLHGVLYQGLVGKHA